MEELAEQRLDMNQLLAGKTAIITGGTRGIGLACAQLFVAHGAHVALFGQNQERGEQVAQQLRGQKGQKIQFFSVDVKNREAVSAGIEAVLGEFGALHILVNNAGITRDNLLLRMSEEQWQEVIDTNLSSAFYTCKAALRPMLKAKEGKIINITSVVGLIGNSGQANYAAAKAGLIGFSKSLAKEVASRGLCVNCVAPGFIHTDMTDVLPDAVKENLKKQIPLQRLGEGDDIAGAVLFLASPLANYITGQVLSVDGGMVM